MAQNSVLLVDDDAKLVKLLKIYFEKDGFIAYTAADGIDALMAVREHRPDIMVLDLMMPGIDGWEVCRRLRKDNDIPIIMLTARDEESDRLVGLELGADDYVTKPFSSKEVVARAKAILRRTNRAVLRKETIKIGGLTIDMDSYQVSRDGQVVELTPTEFKIVELLATNPGKVYSRLQIAEQVHGYTFEGYERTIDAHIKNLRRKLEANPKEPQYIQTVYGMGYKLAGVAKDE
ncbi:response regulator transcription factor [Sporomusa acidovorans]|uniref:response regulator transcription factor n=1 Tax=Sporomusa acidovorans TaxID=112900 RepID=UPI0008806A95|nr:response regulator transcription factor [Sporomusa acidovorans]OZC19071.1 transcriptional regulatory protein YycF [Sporomusa acidovorans DSM 3132]SDD66325.1 two component transcriptional regulator, winged helix family [Sporomusa acidovorans]